MRRAIALLALLLVGRARADEGHTFGVGIVIGSPTGISGKYMFAPKQAVDVCIGGELLGDQGVDVHADYLYHPLSLYDDEDGTFSLPLYFGAGARFLSHSRPHENNDVHLGFRVPVGVSFDFHHIPLDVFIEVALVVDALRSTGEKFGADLNAGIGVRYWF